jgi:hypothetical protein
MSTQHHTHWAIPARCRWVLNIIPTELSRLDTDEYSTSYPSSFSPTGIIRYPLNIILVGPRADLDVLEKWLLPLPGFDTRTVQLWYRKLMQFDWSKEWHRTKKWWQTAMLTWLLIASYLLLDAELLGYVEVWKTTAETKNIQMFVACSTDWSDERAAPDGRRGKLIVFLLNSWRQDPEERTETGVQLETL